MARMKVAMKDISFCVISGPPQQYAEDVPSHCAEASECALAPYSGTQDKTSHGSSTDCTGRQLKTSGKSERRMIFDRIGEVTVRGRSPLWKVIRNLAVENGVREIQALLLTCEGAGSPQ
jgi:hypothetical protein